MSHSAILKQRSGAFLAFPSRQVTINFAKLVDCEFYSGSMGAQEIIRSIEAEYTKSDLPTIYVGDTVKVGVRIQEGGKERVQPYEGVVIANSGGGINESITVRRIFQGVGVERVFLLHSPAVASVQVLRRGRVRRAKLYYLRDRVGKATRVKQRFDRSI
ncbi:50S ribosomal protein L19 [Synechococcus elongatus PCC 6301]|nr:50S ribosomal protein L19 [Synechococcus elongatus PCC 6301]